ncbi:MAG: glycogen/starch/alpha-glucan phosphorylase [Oscillospiraceae bacterium]|nr:glycogen/starch/alpha-glucan phosphorylase [Oscillospiraceae bacterium]
MYLSKTAFKRDYKKKLSSMFGKSLTDASISDKYITLASLIRDTINENWVNTNDTYFKQNERQVYYFSLEFLVGKFLESNLQYLDAIKTVKQGLAEMGIELDQLIEVEPDAGLGNGGLGRLAACFLDSMASQSLPGHGCGIRYKYGLFSQKLIDGYQVELPDNWLREVNAWEICKPDKAVIVRFNGRVETQPGPDGQPQFVQKDYLPVRAVPYDVPIMGYLNDTVNTLRLWSAEAVENIFDFSSFSRGDYINAVSDRYAVEAISEVLYPDDSNYKNRVLRLKQQYFFVSAGLQSIVRYYKKTEKDIRQLADHIVVHINDTHPALAVPELMRILLDEEGLGWDEAWAQTTRIIAYTNHTIMPEALETWPIVTVRELLPRIMMIIDEISHRFREDLQEAYPDDQVLVDSLDILGGGAVRMANLAVVGAFSVNGVSAVHSELLKNSVMKGMHEHFPNKFNNKTNGVTHRRWLLKSNPLLTDFLCESACPKLPSQPDRLIDLLAKQDDPVSLEELRQIKRMNKERLAAFIKDHNGIIVDPDSLFDVQIKRIHAYKRQLLNALHILHLYNRLCDNPDADITPRTFIIAGKAAPSYYYAKNIIKLINELSFMINKNPRVREKLRVVFLENYSIPMAELIFPASDVSEQISTASKEASGTGNMKFMMNGAVTIGTDDGANIEIRELVGDDNFFLFGMAVEDILRYYHEGGYNSRKVTADDPRLSRLMGQLHGGLFTHLPHDEFINIVRSLQDYNDEFFVLGDFDSYAAAQERVGLAYRDQTSWHRRSLVNIAHSGVFSSDRTISQYASEIWRIAPCKPVGILED